jgi:hypothetical protein
MKRFSIVLAAIVMLISTNVYANSAATISCKKPLWGFIDSVGFDWQYGRDYMLPDSWKGEHCLNKVNRWSVRAESRSLLLPEKWGIQLELLYSAHKADEHPDHGQDTGFKELGINLAVKRYFFDDMFYVGWLAGLSYVGEFPNFENRDWPDRSLESNLGRSHYLGTWGPMVGKDWHIYKAWSFKTEMRFTHTSDPFNTDMGKNFLGATVGFTYNF